MSLARQVLLPVLTVALVGYASDCVGMTTPEQAMQCCNTMRCPSRGHHGQECCKTMPEPQAAFGQPSSVQGISFFPVILGAVREFNGSHGIEPSARLMAEHSHAPPDYCSPAVLPLRI